MKIRPAGSGLFLSRCLVESRLPGYAFVSGRSLTHECPRLRAYRKYMAAKILIIEDHLETRDVTTIWLERAGYKVIVANDGKKGLAKVQPERPDCTTRVILFPPLKE